MISDKLPRVTGDDAEELVEFIRNYVNSSGCEGVIIGQSGGVDSAVTVKLAVDALGPERVHPVFLPTDVTSEEDYVCTEKMSELWGMDYTVINIQPAVDAIISILGDELSSLEKGNIAARCRMTVLYERAKKMNCIVVGTSNQSELMMGYFTKYGDGACDLLPLVNMYKTNVWQLARLIGVPSEIIDKPPSAGFWEGQTDEDELGIKYSLLDQILYGLEIERTDKEISTSTGVDIAFVQQIRRRVESMKHKRLPAARPGNVL